MATPLVIAPSAYPTPDRGARSGDELDTLLGIGITVQVAVGQTIVFEDDPMHHCFRILDGAVRLYKSIADGRRQVMDFLTAGDCFGLLGTGRFACSAEAMVATTLVRHPRSQLENAIARDPASSWRLYRIACEELERTQRQMLLLGRKSAEEKIASFLLTVVNRSGLRPMDGLSLRLPMSRQDMADYLGLTIETVSRTFSRLKRRGLIALPTPQQVVLRQCGALLALANGNG
jgi:CRP/FNR family transcriptional regulator